MTKEEKRGISEWIVKGINKGYINGPFDLDFDFGWKIKIAPLFTVPKPVGIRPIVHLSYKGSALYSINDLIVEELATVQYIAFKEVVHLVQSQGVGAWLFVVDAQDAYYRVPIHKSDYQYMGIKWAKKYWVFLSLQMGCSSSPNIYTAFADAVEFIICKNNSDIAYRHGIQRLRHYIDDFFACIKSFEEAWILYNSVIATFRLLGIPTRLAKCFIPSHIRKILGWIYNTLTQMVALPEDKRVEYLEFISVVLNDMQGSKKTMQKVIGRLQRVATIIPLGKAFVRRLEAAIYLPKFEDNDIVHLSNFVLQDLKWWVNILSDPKKCCAPFSLVLKQPWDGDILLYTDATTTIGIGGHTGTHAFQILWKDTILSKIKNLRDNIDIHVLELLGPVIACTLWGHLFSGKAISIYNDNPGAYGALWSKAPALNRLDMQFLTRHLVELARKYRFHFWGIYCTDTRMDIADGLSRFFDHDDKYIIGKNGFIGEPFDNVKKVCNDLLNKLLWQPANLPKNIDISQDIRKEYNILLDEDRYKYHPTHL